MMRAPHSRQSGISMVELMIGITLGLVLMVVVSQILVSNKASFKANEAMSRVQENGRLAMDLLGRDIRLAGYNGCSKGLPINNIAEPTGSSWVSFDKAVIGYTQSTLPTGLGLVATEVLAGTDVIKIQYASSVDASLTGNMSAVNANIQITDNPNGTIQTDDILFLSDCEKADVFRANNVSSGSGKITITHSNASNTGNNLSKAYQGDAELMKLATSIYFIACMSAASAPTSTCSATDPRYLWRKTLSGISLVAQDLVEGVEDMRITYGEDTDGDTVANKYVVAGSVGDWSNVVSVRVSLLLRTVDDKIATKAQTYSYNGSSVTATDLRVRRVYTSTIDLRNKTY